MLSSKLSLVWSIEAENDLIAIWRYGAQEWSTSVADDYQRILWHACRRLPDHPELGKRRPELAAALQSIAVDPHVVFYRIRGEALEIVRILHHSEDVEPLFQ